MRRVLVLSALGLFVFLTVVGIRNLPPIEPIDNAWLPLLLAAVLSGANVFIRGGEFTLSARMMGRSVPLGTATRIAVLSSAANVLPLPGATLVKVQSLKRMGIRYGPGMSVTLAISLVWVAVSALLASVLLLSTSDQTGLGIGMSAGGAVLLLAALVLARMQTLHLSLGNAYMRMLLLEFVGVVMSSARLLCILAALGFDSSWTAGALLSSAGVVATAAGLFPGGLGLRELLSAAIAPAVGLPAAVGTVVAAIDRVLNFVVLGIATLFVLVADRRVPSVSELTSLEDENRSAQAGRE
jgi:hypothetical protein